MAKRPKQPKPSCDRCHRAEPDVAGVFPFTYAPPTAPGRIAWETHIGTRLLCEDCFEYITDAMANPWPEKLVTPDVILRQKDYTSVAQENEQIKNAKTNLIHRCNP